MLLPKRLPADLVRAAGNRPGRTMKIALVVFILAAIAGSRIRIEADFLKLIPDNNPAGQIFRDTIERFGSTDTLLVAVNLEGTEDLDAYQFYADEYVALMRESEYINWVEYRTEEMEQAAESLMGRFTLFMEPEELDQLFARLTTEGAQEAAYRLAEMVQRNMDLAAKKLLTKDPLNVAPLILDSIRVEGMGTRFGNSGYIIDESETMLLILAKPNGAAADIPFAKSLLKELDRIQAEVNEVWLDEGYEGATPEVFYGGGYPIAAAENKLIREDLFIGVAVSLISVVVLFTIAFGRPRAIVVSALPLIIGLTVSLAFAALSLGGLNAATSAFAALLIGLAVDFIIVLYGRYLEERRGGADHDEALQACGTHTATGVLLGAVTTAATFFAFLISGFKGLSELGLLTGCGILVLVVTVFLLLPALLGLLERDRRIERNRMNAFGIDRLTYWGAKNPRVALGLGAAATLLLAIPAFRITYDDNVLNMRSPKNPGMVAQSRIMDAFDIRFTPYMIRVDADNESNALKRAREIMAELAPYADGEQLARVDSLLSLLPPQEQQQAVLAKLATFEFDREAFRNAFNQRLDEKGLATAAFQEGIDTVFQALDVTESLATAALKETTVGHLLERYLSVHEDGAAALVYAYAPSGKRLDQLPAGLQKVISENPDARLTGPISISIELKKIVLRDALIALILGTFIVFLMLSWELGGLKPGLLALLPLLAGCVWMLGTMSLLGLPTNYMNLFVFTMIIGIGVDYGIHLIHRLSETDDIEALAATSRTIVIAAMTTVVGFGSLVFSHYPGLQSMGMTAILGALYSMLAAIVLLPALAYVGKPDKPNQT